MPAPTRNLVLAAALAFVAGVSLGYTLRSPSTRADDTGAGDPSAGNDSADARDLGLSSALHELSAAVADLRHELALPRAPSAVSATPIDGSGPSASERAPARASATTPSTGGSTARDRDPELAAALRELADALRTGAPATRHADEAPWVDRDVAFGRSTVHDAELAGDEVAEREARDELTRRHMLWTSEQVLEAYGKPDRVNVRENDTWVWVYDKPALGDGREQYEIHFHSGLVYRVLYDWDPE